MSPDPASALLGDVARKAHVSRHSIRIKRLHANARLPERATAGSTGYDLYACLEEPLEVGPEPVRVPTGFAMEFASGLDVQIRPRSGLPLPRGRGLPGDLGHGLQSRGPRNNEHAPNSKVTDGEDG